MLLLDLLLSHGVRDLLVCHVDHALRPESADDARFVAGIAARHRLPFASTRVEVAAHAKKMGKSIETAARETRHAFFARTARENDCPRLFLAHHADDQAETLLFNLFRGAAASGLAAMRPLAAQEIEGFTFQISRPLLGVWREEIDVMVARREVSFREDSSNAGLEPARNRMRHEIIPSIERVLGRGVTRSVWRAAEILREEDDFLKALASEFALSDTLSVPELRAQPVALQRRILHAWLKAARVPEPGFEDVENVRAMLSEPRAKVNLPGGYYARRRAKVLFLEMRAARQEAMTNDE